MKKSSRTKRKESASDLKRLQTNKNVAQERLELLNEIIEEMERTGGMPDIKLGGLLDDLFILNPFRAEQIIPQLRDQYKSEVEEINQLIAGQN